LVTPTEVQIDSTSPSAKTANITISWSNNKIARTVPILDDGNFIFVMTTTTNQGFDTYINQNFPEV